MHGIFSAPFEMLTKYADRSVAVILEVSFIYSSKEKVASVLIEAFLSYFGTGFHITEYVLSPPLEVKDMGPPLQVHECRP